MISSKLQMRRFENGTRDPEMIAAILDQIKIVHVGCFDEEYPYVVPLSYGYEIKDGKLLVYLHGAREGHKVDLWKKNPHVALTFSTFYNHPDRLYKGCMHDFRSVMALGTIAPVDRDMQSRIHGTAVQTVLRQNARKPTQFSVPHYMWMGMYVVTCDMENVVGKFENPIEDPSEVPFPNVYDIPEDNEPYDCAYFYHKKQRNYQTGVWETHELKETSLLPEKDKLKLPSHDVKVTFQWTVDEEYQTADFDVAALLLDEMGKVPRRYDMVFYNQLGDRSNTVIHMGDDANEKIKGQESFILHLGTAPDYLSQIIITLNSAEAEKKQVGLELLKTIQMTVVDMENNTEIGSWYFDASELEGPAMALLSVERNHEGWQFGKELKKFDSSKILDQARAYGLVKWKE